jgi:hypothetical protein
MSDPALFYMRGLLENIVPFWPRHAPDRQTDGCLDRAT